MTASLLSTRFPGNPVSESCIHHQQLSMTLQVEVVYATRERQRVASYEVHTGADVEEVLQLVAADPLFADLDVSAHSIGVFGRPCEPSTPLKDGDRVELYRDLEMDAKTARHLRAQQQRESPEPQRK